MTLEDLGYNTEFKKHRQENDLESLRVGRVVTEHKERYVVKTEDKEYEAEILGNLRFTATSREDFPAVGDWVSVSPYDEDKALIHTVFPRKSILERQSVGSSGEKQIIATNIDAALIVQAVDRDFSLNRLERYLTICHSSKVEPIIVLSKIDTVDQVTLTQHINTLNKRMQGVLVLPVSNESREGIDNLKKHIKKGKTYCLLGSSGVGKSTLLNTISGESLMKTGEISDHSDRGRHVTTHRELIVLKSGGIFIDNPGMREVGIADSSEGLDITFSKIQELARECRFKDCSHSVEVGCAVTEAVNNGEIDQSALDNFHKMEREKDHYESTVAEKRKKDKGFGKLVKDMKKVKKINKQNKQ